MLAATPFPACSLSLPLSFSISLGRSHLRFGSCQHLEKLKVAISAAHKFEAALVFKVSCSAEKGEKMHMQMQTSRYAAEQASIYCIPCHTCTLLLSIAYSQLHLRGMWQQKNRIEIPRCHLRLCFLLCDTWQIVFVLFCCARCCCCYCLLLPHFVWLWFRFHFVLSVVCLNASS